MIGKPAIARAISVLPLSGERLAIALILFPWLAGAGQVEDGYFAYQHGDFETALRLLAPAATEDEPGLQNLVALMHYRGQGTDVDPVAAHDLFHQAAMNGSSEARINLGVLHTLGAPGVEVNFEEARIWFATAQATGNEDPPGVDTSVPAIPDAIDAVIAYENDIDSNGKSIYLTFCAGCHGFSGMHFFKYAPSFAMGQRLTKSDNDLMSSIRHGKGLMPSWEGKLPRSDLEDALAYLRLLSIRTAYGMNTSSFDDQPEMYFIFYPRGSGTENDFHSTPDD